MIHRRPLLLAVGLVIGTTAIGCKAKPAPDSGFLQEPHKMTKDERLPFQRVWYKPDADWDRYVEVLVAPVNTDFLLKMTWWDQISFAGDNREDAMELARYTKHRLEQALRDDPKQRLKLVDTPGPKTLVLEIAIVELTPTNAWLNVAGYAGIGAALDKGAVAIEARMRDGATREVLAMVADREEGKTALVSVADLTWYSHARNVVDEWAEQLVAIVNAEDTEAVTDSSPFTLRPW